MNQRVDPRDPELAEAVFYFCSQGRVFNALCKACEDELVSMVQFVYETMRDEFCVWYEDEYLPSVNPVDESTGCAFPTSCNT